MNVNLGYKRVYFAILKLFSAIGGKELFSFPIFLIWVQVNYVEQSGIYRNYSLQAMCYKELQLSNVTEPNGLT